MNILRTTKTTFLTGFLALTIAGCNQNEGTEQDSDSFIEQIKYCKTINNPLVANNNLLTRIKNTRLCINYVSSFNSKSEELKTLFLTTLDTEISRLQAIEKIDNLIISLSLKLETAINEKDRNNLHNLCDKAEEDLRILKGSSSLTEILQTIDDLTTSHSLKKQ